MRQTSARLDPPPITLLSGATLFLDFDGTLVEFASRPESVVVGDELSRLIEQLVGKLDGRIAIVSGRPVDQVMALFGNVTCAIAGSHGLELRWPDGRTLSTPRPARLDEIEAEMDRFAAEHPGVLLERKPFGAALHYRMASNAADACRDLARSLAERTGLQVQPGNMVFELKAPTADKGSAVRSFMTGPQMAGTSPIFIGDDLTDEAGFAAVAELGGAGILVGPVRPTAAQYLLPDVAATLAWLEAAGGHLA